MKKLLIKFWRLVPHTHKAKMRWFDSCIGQMEVCRCYAYRTGVSYYGEHAYWKPWKRESI